MGTTLDFKTGESELVEIILGQAICNVNYEGEEEYYVGLLFNGRKYIHSSYCSYGNNHRLLQNIACFLAHNLYENKKDGFTITNGERFRDDRELIISCDKLKIFTAKELRNEICVQLKIMKERERKKDYL